MKTLDLNRAFLRRPWSVLIILLISVLLFELLSWGISPDLKIVAYNQSDGFFSYLFNWVFGFYFPEFITLTIIIVLIDNYHRVLRLSELPLKARDFLLYELKFFPLLLGAYFIFIPITLHVRFFLREFPHYSAERYETYYQNLLYTYDGYMTYTPFVLVLGYILLNTSLIVDFLQNLKNSADPEATVLGAFASFASGAPRRNLQTIEAKTLSGDTLLNVADCYLFETEEGVYYVEHSKGRSVVTKSLAELENELDPDRFFRGNRNFILNLDYFDSYAYWEKGKYILRSQKLPGKDLVMPRARMQNLKETLEKNLANSAERNAIDVKEPPGGPSGNS